MPARKPLGVNFKCAFEWKFIFLFQIEFVFIAKLLKIIIS